MPFYEIEGCDGIFYGRVTDVCSTRLNSPPKVLFDSTEHRVKLYIPRMWSRRRKNRDVQISQCPSVWRSGRMTENDSSVDVPRVNHPQCLEIVLESVPY